MENLYSYLKAKLKSKNMKIETFIKKTEMSKSTIYRVMKGYQKASDELIEKFIEILNLNSYDEQKLRYYCNLVNADGQNLAAKNAVFDLLYKEKDDEYEPKELIYYDKDKYIRTFDEVLENIVELSSNGLKKCRFRMLDCYENSIVLPILKTYTKLSEKNIECEIEHLVNLSNPDSRENIIVLSEIIPLLQLDNYNPSFVDLETATCNGLFKNFIMIDYEYENTDGEREKNYLVISFLKDNLSTCYIINEKNNLLEFFERNYNSLFANYTKSDKDDKSFEILGGMLESLESRYETYLFKPNPCYNRIPEEVYKEVFDRVSDDKFSEFVKNTFVKDDDIKFLSNEEIKEKVFMYMKNRINMSHKHKQVDIFTKIGLEKFAKTGMLSDHLIGIPPFTKDERRKILENIISKSNNKKDKYNFYIMDKEYSNENLVITVFRNKSVMIEYSNPDYSANYYPYYILDKKELSNIFYEFAENYVPMMLSMPKEKAAEYINTLIEMYCK